MGVYGPDITKALEPYATQFDDITVEERTPIIDLNAINPVSSLRSISQNVSSDQTEHKLSTSAGVDEVAFLETKERGQYTAGYEAQAGIGVRTDGSLSNDEVRRWGYYTTDSNNEPLDGWYFGEDSSGNFVVEVRNGVKQKVYQQSWSEDVADGDGDSDENPSGFNLDLQKGNIFQVEFVYYGYGPVRMGILTDEGKVTLHEFTHDGQTSVTNTNLPLQTQIDSGGTNADATNLFVGGRQFSIIGHTSTNARRAGHYRDSLSGIDDTQWYPVESVRLKNGSDIGSINFTHIIGSVIDFETDTDNTGYRWQVRRGTSPNNPTWVTPSTHTDTPDETAMKVDVSSTNIQDGSGNTTGVFVDGGTLSAGGNNSVNIQQQDASGEIVNGETMTVVVQAIPGGSGTITESFISWEERW